MYATLKTNMWRSKRYLTCTFIGNSNLRKNPLRENSTKIPEKGETRVSMVQPTKSRTTRREVKIIQELFIEAAKDAYCRVTTTRLWMRGLIIHVDQYELLVRTSEKYSFQHGVVPVSLTERILHSGHYTPIAEHPGKLRMYDKA